MGSHGKSSEGKEFRKPVRDKTTTKLNKVGFQWSKRRNLFPCGQSSRKAIYPQRLYNLPPWRFSRTDWINSWALWNDPTADHSWSNRLSQKPCEVPSYLNCPVMLWTWQQSGGIRWPWEDSTPKMSALLTLTPNIHLDSAFWQYNGTQVIQF